MVLPIYNLTSVFIDYFIYSSSNCFCYYCCSWRCCFSGYCTSYCLFISKDIVVSCFWRVARRHDQVFFLPQLNKESDLIVFRICRFSRALFPAPLFSFSFLYLRFIYSALYAFLICSLFIVLGRYAIHRCFYF